MMSKVRGRDNRAEKLLRRALWARGFRYRLHRRDLPGRPDLVLPKWRAIIFVDGDFWHARALLEGGKNGLRQVIRGAGFEWWLAKLKANAERDRKVTRVLRAQGWRVIRLWESDILLDVEQSADKVSRRIVKA